MQLSKALRTGQVSKKTFSFFFFSFLRRRSTRLLSLDEHTWSKKIRRDFAVTAYLSLTILFAAWKKENIPWKHHYPFSLIAFLTSLNFFLLVWSAQGTGVLKHCLYTFIYTLLSDYPQVYNAIYIHISFIIFNGFYIEYLKIINYFTTLDYSYGWKNIYWGKIKLISLNDRTIIIIINLKANKT